MGNGWVNMIKMHYTKFPIAKKKLREKKKTQNTKLFVQGIDGYTCKRQGTQGEKPKSTEINTVNRFFLEEAESLRNPGLERM